MAERLNSAIAILLTLTFISCSSAWIYMERTSRRTRMICNSNKLPHVVKLPIFKSAWQVIDSCDVHFPADTAIAIVVFENRWFEKFGRSKEVFSALENLVVEWSQRERYLSGYFIDGKSYHQRRVTGLLLGPGHIWVYTKPGMRICRTSLIHELVHASIRARKGTDGDPDHEGPIFSGWTSQHTEFIVEVNREICELGL